MVDIYKIKQITKELIIDNCKLVDFPIIHHRMKKKKPGRTYYLISKFLKVILFSLCLYPDKVFRLAKPLVASALLTESLPYHHL